MTIKKVELIEKKEFVAIVLNLNNEVFIFHLASIVSSDLAVYPFHQAQIVSLKTDETFTAIPSKYTDFINVFYPDLATELPKYTGINNHTIELIDSKQILYGQIYSLELVEVKSLKTYIETNLATNFIRPSKFPVGTSMHFVWKLDSSF